MITLEQIAVSQVFKKPKGLLSGHIFATQWGYSGVFKTEKPLTVLETLKNL
jgi:hypothetical protein